MRGSRRIAKSRRPKGQLLGARRYQPTCTRLLPEAESAADRCHFRARRFIAPRGAGVPRAVDDDIVELHAVRTVQVVCGSFGLFEPIHAHRGAWKVLVSLAFNDIVALGDRFAFDHRLHDPLSVRTVKMPRPLETKSRNWPPIAVRPGGVRENPSLRTYRGAPAHRKVYPASHTFTEIIKFSRESFMFLCTAHTSLLSKTTIYLLQKVISLSGDSNLPLSRFSENPYNKELTQSESPRSKPIHFY